MRRAYVRLPHDEASSGPRAEQNRRWSRAIRAENWREGIEDYEYLYLLRQLRERVGQAAPQAAQEADQLLQEVSDMHPYGRHFSQPPTTDPTWILDRRRRMAGVIETLQASTRLESVKVEPFAARKTAKHGKRETP